MLSLEDFTARLLPVLRDAGVLGPQSGMGELARLKAVAELVQTRVQTLSETVPLIAPFYVRGDELQIGKYKLTYVAEKA